MKVKTKKHIHDESLFERHNRNLRPSHVYVVIGIDSLHYRVFNENFEPMLYPKEIFDLVDESVPVNWIREEFSDGDYYLDPPELASPELYEDFFDGVTRAIETVMRYLISESIVTEREWWEGLAKKKSHWSRSFVKARGKTYGEPRDRL